MDNYTVRQQAADDMDNIADYIFESSPKMAQSFYDEAQQLFSLLGGMPKLGIEIDFIKTRQYRMFPMRRFKSYLIFYVIENGVPQIVRVLHGKRKIEDLFDEEY